MPVVCIHVCILLMLQEFTAARYIRLRMQRIRTLNADLMMAIEEDPRYLDPTVTNRVSITLQYITVFLSGLSKNI